MRTSSLVRLLLASTAGVLGVCGATSVWAQAGAPAPQAAQADATLGDIVVTATRQADTVGRVPLSITAVTQKSLDQSGIRTVPDLQRIVPSLQITNQGGTDQITIRGITSLSGAATTGVYLDDTPLTKRNENGSVTLSNNGVPVPPLFDLERVEVLRGPQGTLYGGSSEGGTMRFITPAPSTSTYSVFGRAQVSQTDYGGLSYEEGLAVGGPIVQDKLGFRASAFGRHTAGYIDEINPYTTKVSYKDANWGDTQVFRGQLLWRPTERSSITLSAYNSVDYQNDTGNYTLPEPQTNVQISQSGFLPASLVTAGWGLATPLCIAFKAPSATVTATQSQSSSQTPVACGSSGITHVYPATTLGPYNLAPYQNVASGTPGNTSFRTEIDAVSLTGDYDFGWSDLKSITSFLHDKEKKVGYDVSVVSKLEGGFLGLVPGAPDWNQNGDIYPLTKRNGIVEEVRLTSPAYSRPFSWIFGFYY